ncbi:MAG: MlaD family protein [Lautropia sp.]|nr:MlaD family protein [Lautropia sp.]
MNTDDRMLDEGEVGQRRNGDAASGSRASSAHLPDAIVEDRRYRWLPSLIWLLPLLAALIGAILTYRELTRHGPVIMVSFKTAEGLEAGKTKLRYKDVEIGTVKSIQLAEDRSHVQVSIQLGKESAGFQAKDSRYWVVRPRADVSGVSGLSTLLSGAYIGVDAGKSEEISSYFEGLETPPQFKYDEAGTQFTLHARDIGSLDIGSPVLYRRVTVGRVTRYALDDDGEGVTLGIFINKPYDRFVGVNTRFWEASGLEAQFDASGVKLNTQSLMTVVLGGIAFASPIEGKGEPASAGTPFVLAADQASALKRTDGPSQMIELNFDQSLRGLQVGASVDFRGVELGQVRAIDVMFDRRTGELHMPVLIEIFPYRLLHEGRQPGMTMSGSLQERQQAEEQRNELIRLMVERGLRAQLRTGNLLSGQLYVALDFFPQAKPARLKQRGNMLELPTVPNSLDEFQSQITDILKRLKKVPFEQIGRELRQTISGMRRTVSGLEKTIQGLNRDLAPQLLQTVQSLKKTLDTADRTLSSANRTLASDSPAQEGLQQTLRSVSKAADSLRRLTDYLERHPESLIRGKTGN